MSRRTLNIVAIVGVVALLSVGAVAAYILRPSAAPSGEITAIPVETKLPTAEIISEQPTATAEEETPESPAPHTYELSQSESEARFTINEILNGSPNTVVGVTSELAGQIVVDPSEPKASQVGVIRINARGFTTDNSFRNRAINNEILETDQYEFITFAPTSINGMPDSVADGESISFQITGELTIRDITLEQTFDVTVTLTADGRLEGLASTQLDRNDYSLVIPQVRSVASVDEIFLIELEFVALPQ